MPQPSTNPYELPVDHMLGYDATAMDPYYPTPMPFTRQPVHRVPFAYPFAPTNLVLS